MPRFGDSGSALPPDIFQTAQSVATGQKATCASASAIVSSSPFHLYQEHNCFWAKLLILLRRFCKPPNLRTCCSRALLNHLQNPTSRHPKRSGVSCSKINQANPVTFSIGLVCRRSGHSLAAIVLQSQRPLWGSERPDTPNHCAHHGPIELASGEERQLKQSLRKRSKHRARA